MYGKATYNRIKEFTDKYGFGIAKAIANTGLYFPAVVGQSAYESGYGERIPPNSNNFGGIKYNPNLICESAAIINKKSHRLKCDCKYDCCEK